MNLTCLNCNHVYDGVIYHDKLGYHGVCPKCGASFPVEYPKGSKECVTLNYGYQETENGIWHAFEATDPSDHVDTDKMTHHLAKLLDTTSDDNRFNWSSMDIRLPDSLVRKIKEKGVMEALAKLTPAELSKTPSCYLVKKIGSDAVATETAASREEALVILKEFYEKTLKDHNNGSWFDYKELDEESGTMTVYREEFFQYAYIIPANDCQGLFHDLEEIRRNADEAGIYAQCYEYEQQTMEDVFGTLGKIRDLADKMEQKLQLREKTTRSERSYVDILADMNRAISADACMPDAVATKASVLLDQLQSILWSYSA